MKTKYLFTMACLSALFFASCESGDQDFPDYDYQTVYFPNQTVDRTVELGEDEFINTEVDNQHKIHINAAWGGGYNNGHDVMIKIVVDNSLVEGLKFSDGTTVEAMPASYYKLAEEYIRIPKGKIQGGVEVDLTDAFFADPLSTTTHYVIPVRMVAVEGADSILSGKPAVATPDLLIGGDWTVAPRNYVLYGVKYANPWQARYLRRGTDVITRGTTTETVVRHQQYVENDEAISLSTRGLQQALMPFTGKDAGGKNISCNLVLTFDNNGQCTVTSATDGVTATGKGSFVLKGEKKSLGGKDRNALYLDYSVNFADRNISYATKDTLVVQTRDIAPSYFSYTK